MSNLGETLGNTAGAQSERATTAAEPQLVVALECDRPLAGSSRHSLARLHRVDIGRGETRAHHRDGHLLEIRVPDPWMSGSHAHLQSSFGRWILCDDGSKNGSAINGAPVTRQALCDGDLIELGHTLFLFREHVEVSSDAPADLEAGPGAGPLATLVPELGRQLQGLAQLAKSDLPVLLLGESGTGKEVVARQIHRASGRAGDFVAVNCGAIPATLIESELFGHRKGAFSGAVSDSVGLVRSADRGTLLLDEIADLPMASQAAILRVLQEREVRPVGATRSVAVDLRLVSATHRELDQMVQNGDFREDLFARIAGYRMTLPPLRERIDDLGLLIAALLSRTTGGEEVTITGEAARAMFQHRWPRNIRELENCLHAATVLSAGKAIELAHLPAELGEQTGESGLPAAPVLSAKELAHRDQLVELLSRHAGNISAVARELGKDRKQVHRWLKRYQLDPGEFRAP